MTAKSHNYIPELWGGIECSINRVGDNYFDQLEFVNHYQRGEDDIRRIAELGVKKLRYPILWEYHQPYSYSKIDWSWSIAQLNAIKQNGMIPIAGLLHHGSGPHFTSLYDKHFSIKLAEYAFQVANQFPWIEYYTPINEPLTTARFSGLYGLWYPHYKDDHSFVTMLLIQLKGIVLSMRAVRKVNPHAKLIQTEDLGKTYSTPKLQYQANFENKRRWLTFDFLCGKVDKRHPLWKYFMRLGFSEKEILYFQDNPCPPDTIGVNHYLTSERYLDEKLNLYPLHTHGGNKRHSYADIEAIRVKHQEPHGLEVLLKEAWERFELPIALTEVHIHCTREEQMRWLAEKFKLAIRLQQQDIPVDAVTVWSMFGASGWNKLLTGLPFNYESGVFDFSTGEPRVTALSELLKSFALGQSYNHPLLDQPSWWQRSDRFIIKESNSPQMLNTTSQALFIISYERNLLLAECIHYLCKQRGILSNIIHVYDGQDEFELEHIIQTYNPWALFCIKGSTLYSNSELCSQLNCDFNTSLRIVELIPAWFEVCDTFLKNSTPHTLLIKGDILGSSTYIKIEKLFKSNPSRLPLILASFPYIAEFIHSALNLLIDNEHGVWEVSKTSPLTLVQEPVNECMLSISMD